MKVASGTLLYRAVGRTIEVLLVHPSGNYNRHAPWSIPKGVPEEGESLEQTARRETLEETSVAPTELWPLGAVQYRKSRKRVECFVGPAPENASPRCASWEVDRAEFVSLEEAQTCLHPDQLPLIEMFTGWLSERLGDSWGTSE